MNITDIKKSVYTLVQSGNLSTKVLNELIPDGVPIPRECELWDYKEAFEAEAQDYAKTSKSIASFYNTYGGYIVYGIKEVEKDKIFEVAGIPSGEFNLQKLKGQLDKYFGNRLDVSYLEFGYGTPEVTVGLLHIPKRPDTSHTISAGRRADDSKNKQIFSEGWTLYRKGDECRQAVTLTDFEFLTSSRDLIAELEGRQFKKMALLDHNLPDRNFICPHFVGRVEIIQKLWAWLSDEFQYAKVLAGEGGKGKTSIAYEFCQLIASTGAPLFYQIIWLTAKTKQFKAGVDDYIGTPETHYSDLESLLVSICEKTGSTDDELDDLSINQLKRITRQNLQSVPSFIVIDDVDSTELDEQKRIMETAREIGNGNSKILLTTRANVSYSSDTAIEVPGLSGEEYDEYIDELKSSMGFEDISSRSVRKLAAASEGSPLFTESILRLCRVGYSIDNAIAEWEGKKGEAVRSAALRREIERLSPEARKVLLTISYIGSCSLAELRLYTELEQLLIEDSIEELGKLFLLQSASFIESDPRFKSSQSIANLTLSMKEHVVTNADRYLGYVKGRAQGMKANAKQSSQAEVGEAIRQSIALLKESDYVRSRATIKALLKKQQFKYNPDLLLALAKVEAFTPKTDINIVRTAFKDAYQHGQRKELLFDLWYQVEAQVGSTSEVVEICRLAITEGRLANTKWYRRSAEAKFQLSNIVGSLDRRLELLNGAYDDASKSIRKTHGALKQEIKELSVRLMDRLWALSSSEREDFAGLKAMNKAIKAGDIRSINYYRLSEAANSVFDIYHSQATTPRRKKEIEPSYRECQRVLADVIESIDLARSEVHHSLETTYSRFKTAQ